MSTSMTYLIRADFPRYKRPVYLNTNYSGSAWGPRGTAERFPSREAAERRINCPAFPRATIARVSIEERV